MEYFVCFKFEGEWNSCSEAFADKGKAEDHKIALKAEIPAFEYRVMRSILVDDVEEPGAPGANCEYFVFVLVLDKWRQFSCLFTESFEAYQQKSDLENFYEAEFRVMGK